MWSPKLLLALALVVATADAQYFGAGRRQATTYSTSKAAARPWWRGFFPSSSPSSALLPDEREIFPEWFEAEEPEDCERVPETVNTGRPRDLCGDVSY